MSGISGGGESAAGGDRVQHLVIELLPVCGRSVFVPSVVEVLEADEQAASALQSMLITQHTKPDNGNTVDLDSL